MKFKLATALLMASMVLSAQAEQRWNYQSVTAPGGTDGQVQVNSGGSFGSASNIYYNSTTNVLGISTTTPQGTLENAGQTLLGLGAYSTSSAWSVVKSAAASLGSSGALATWLRSPLMLSFSNSVGGNIGIGQIHTTGGLPTNQLYAEMQACGSTASNTIVCKQRAFGKRTTEAWTTTAQGDQIEFSITPISTTQNLRNMIFDSSSTLKIGTLLNSTQTSTALIANGRVLINSAVGADPSATLHVSGTSILGICNASMTCGTSQQGATCWSTVKKSWAGCDGASSWVVQTSTTSVSASAL
ncbi:hypothetical protein Rleg2_1156 [Rhizobium leguminosarum bv. trifolii WSM2304]|uniref:Uncharacterized protein n=1 Tax=Rhizobium leguminosarum bv. trifolii (strain WSM2304) TaxID=395492 RepID=A0ABF7QKR6_RHILW|nr:hypothetical protein [Rhizobium leguminosarum]ACI54450.1 hypothetical protein Rleg2_1156 [Rhizobium leguminosarum bv. trifolii WSM2304]